MTFSDRLRQAREAAGLTQLELAKKLNVTKSSVCNYENGVSSPKEDVMLRIFDALNVAPNFLFQDSFSAANVSDVSCCEFPRYLGESDPPTNSELELLRKLRALSPVHRAAIETLVEQFYPVDSGEKRGDVSGTA